MWSPEATLDGKWSEKAVSHLLHRALDGYTMVSATIGSTLNDLDGMQGKEGQVKCIAIEMFVSCPFIGHSFA